MKIVTETSGAAGQAAGWNLEGLFPMARVVGDRLRVQGATLAVAESCTGGLLGAAISQMPGCSDYFLGGVIAYTNSVKVNVLDVPDAMLRTEGAVSEAVARAMARAIRRRFGADYGLAVTGIAGPGGGTPGKPVGTVWLAASDRDKVLSEPLVGATAHDDRATIRNLAVIGALSLLRRLMQTSVPVT